MMSPEMTKCGKRLSRTTIKDDMNPAMRPAEKMAMVFKVSAPIDELQKLTLAKNMSFANVVNSNSDNPPMTVAIIVNTNFVRRAISVKCYFGFFGTQTY